MQSFKTQRQASKSIKQARPAFRSQKTEEFKDDARDSFNSNDFLNDLDVE